MIIILVSGPSSTHTFEKKNCYKLHEGIIYIPTAGPELGSGGFAHEIFKWT